MKCILQIQQTGTVSAGNAEALTRTWLYVWYQKVCCRLCFETLVHSVMIFVRFLSMSSRIVGFM